MSLAAVRQHTNGWQIKRKAGKLLLVLGAVLFTALLAEGFSYVYLDLFPPIGGLSRWEFRATRPAPYRYADYFNSDFLLESMQCPGLKSVEGKQYSLPVDYEGRHIQVRAGQRRTTDQPADFNHRVLVFGGSTVFDAEVPDTWTIASCLQRLLNDSGERWRVENYGTCSMNARQQTERLSGLELRPGDMVVFYDGVNDVFQGIYNGHPEGWVPGHSHDGGVRRLTWAQRHLYPVCFQYKDRSAFCRLLFSRLDCQMPGNIADRQLLDEHLAAAETGFRTTLLEAHTCAQRHDAHFVHFLQPNLYTVQRRSAYEEEVSQKELRGLPGLDHAFAVGYPRLRQAIAAAAKESLVSFDLASALDQRSPGEEFFLDFCHVNHAANDRIARMIYAAAFAGKASHKASE